MKDTATILAAVCGIVAVLSFAIWWQVTVWQECRTDHSFMYCLTLMNGK